MGYHYTTLFLTMNDYNGCVGAVTIQAITNTNMVGTNMVGPPIIFRIPGMSLI